MKTRSESPDVFYPADDLILAGTADIDRLKRAAIESPRRRARICTHPGPSAGLHEMLIVLQRESYVRPHKHLDRSESFSVFEGAADVILFDDDGTVRDVIAMGPVNSSRTFYYRLTQPVFHTVVVRSESLLFHEVTEGPFRPEQTVFATWSPDGRDPEAVAAYRMFLSQQRPTTSRGNRRSPEFPIAPLAR